jgi:hypothetical protein
LRALCRDEIALIEQRTALVNQLQAALREYYPAALEAFDDWTAPYAWALLLQFPTPAQLQAAGKRKWEKFLHTQHLWRPQTAKTRLEVFGNANALTASPPVTTAKSLLAVSLAKSCSPYKPNSRNTAAASLRPSDNIPIRTCSAPCPGPRPR